MALALDVASDRSGRYFGWDFTDWVRTVHPLIAGWAESIGLEPGFPASGPLSWLLSTRATGRVELAEESANPAASQPLSAHALAAPAALPR